MNGFGRAFLNVILQRILFLCCLMKTFQQEQSLLDLTVLKGNTGKKV